MQQTQKFAEAEALWKVLPVRDRRYLAATSESIRSIAKGKALETLKASSYRPDLLERWYARFEKVRGVFKKPGFFSLMREAFGSTSVYDRFLYVTDGGHYDNLGLLEALRRRPDRIYVLDASNDPEDTFHTLGQAMATAQMDLSCEIKLDPRGMARMKETRSGAAWCTGTFRYADGGTGDLFVAKAVLTKDNPWDVEAYAAAHAEFPRTSTGRQLYSEFDFEAYRALGHYATTRLLEEQRLKDWGVVRT